MNFIKKILRAMWEIDYYFSPDDLGKLIYDIKKVDSYVRGKFNKFQKVGIGRFQEELDGNRLHHLSETVLAFCGLFTYPFIKRMAKHTNIGNGNYVRFYGNKCTYRHRKYEDQFWVVFHMPSLNMGTNSEKSKRVVLRGSFRQFKEKHDYLAEHIGRVEDLMVKKTNDPIMFGFLDNISKQFPSENHSRFIEKNDVLWDTENISLKTKWGKKDMVEYGELLSDEVVKDLLENGNTKISWKDEFNQEWREA